MFSVMVCVARAAAKLRCGHALNRQGECSRAFGDITALAGVSLTVPEEHFHFPH